jgi:hypothetical protein
MCNNSAQRAAFLRLLVEEWKGEETEPDSVRFEVFTAVTMTNGKEKKQNQILSDLRFSRR